MKSKYAILTLSFVIGLLAATSLLGQTRIPMKPNLSSRKIPRNIILKPSRIKKTTAKMTNFDPKEDGFQFSNSFKTELVLKDVRFGGLCGGMSYTALDYYYGNKPIANQDYRPAVNTTLFNRIYRRQETSIVQNADKWAELIFNPFGARSDEFFRWGLEGKRGGRLQELRSKIDAGKPVPLGLFKDGDGGMRPHHQVVRDRIRHGPLSRRFGSVSK